MTFMKLMTSAAVVALLSGPALAQDKTPDPVADPGTGTSFTDPVTPAPLFASIDEMTVGDVIGMIVYDPDGDRIGEIDYVVPHGDGYAGVIGIGGFLGLAEYTVALPLEEFQLAPEGASFTLDTDKETLKQTPEFDESGAESPPDETPIAELLDRDDSDSAQESEAETPRDSMTTSESDTLSGGAEVDAEIDAEAAEADGNAEAAEAEGNAGAAALEDCPTGTTVAECVEADPVTEGETPATESK
ncbi:MAG: PRC-barrel domain containing protein [Rhodobacteraceae bacterium]|nr:MAG: PRC-barrel domain containing protein [Paracoccaceae bacterium]